MKNTIKKYLTMTAICGLLAMPSCAVSDEADVLWKQVEEAGQLKPAPADWQTNRPSQLNLLGHLHVLSSSKQCRL